MSRSRRGLAVAAGHLVLAGSVLATVPILILFFLLRRQFMEGSSFTGTGVQ